MKACLDTNVFAQLFSSSSPFPQILDRFIHGRFELLVSTEILLEYEEVVVREFGFARWNRTWALIQKVNALHKTVVEVKPQYRFAVISNDPDDNKFVDCAVVGGATLLVTSDRHFAEVENSGYAVRVVGPEEFATLI
jgi:putative PIN family toxin of toxin-antitoxin system